MKPLQLKLDRDIRYKDDVERMRRILAAKGFAANDILIQAAWRQWSREHRCAGWYCINEMPDDWIAAQLLTELEPALIETKLETPAHK